MEQKRIAEGSTLSGFTVERVEQVAEVRCEARILRHARTGARLVHLRNDDPNKLFCCAFRTPVSDSTGVPHILEHSVLGGSRKFPVKDPFQHLLKSSLQTFLNALTYPDRTLYPVASQVEKDFYNLVDVYCDAVFHPLLTERTFCQEGWHFDVEDQARPVGLKGIVYNEMKGVFSDFTSHVARRTFSALMPDTPYFFESGGEPEHIPELTYEAFRAFHARYYHPSNAFIYLYGDQDTARTCALLEERYLHDYERLAIDSSVAPQPLWREPRTLEIEAPAPAEDQGTATVNVCWLFGATTDPVRSLAGTVLTRYLVATESSPLRRALIDSGLGEDLDELCGYDGDLVQGMFAAGLRKTRPEHAGAIEQLVLDSLRRQADGEMDEDLLEGALRQVEFGLREIADSGRWPYGLRLGERVYRAWIYGADPLTHVAFGRSLDMIRRGPAPAFFRRVIREALVDNPHRLLAVVKASEAMGKRLERQSEEQAARLSAGFTDKDRQRYHLLTRELLAEQARRPTPEELATLPRLGRADLPEHGIETPAEIGRTGGAPLYAHPLFCGGIAYADIGFDCRGLPLELVPYLPLYCEVLARCGAAGLSYEQMATRIARATGGVHASILIDYTAGEQPQPFFRVFLHGKCLDERFGDMMGVFADLLTAPKLDEGKLVTDILRELRNDMNASVLRAGHSYASLHAAARLDALRRVEDAMEGIGQLRFLERLVQQGDMGVVAGRLRDVHAAVVRRTGALVSLTAGDPGMHAAACGRVLESLPQGTDAAPAQWAPDRPDLRTGVEINAAVNFVAQARALPAQGPESMGLLAIICGNLSRGYLWDRVRVEGGAYGSFASLEATYPVLTLASYRDPNLARTLGVFDGVPAYAAGLDTAAVDESVVAAIGQIDRPRTPHARGFGETLSLLLGRTRGYRAQLRRSVLTATAERVRAAAAGLYGSGPVAVTVLGSAAAFDKAQAEGVTLKREPLLGSGVGRQ